MATVEEAGVPWLDDEERATWLVLIATLVKVPAALDAQLTRDSAMTLFEYTVMAALSERPDRTARMSQLAPLANGSLSRLSHVARRLEARDLLRRRPDPTDGRFTEAILTEKGGQAMRAAAPGHVRAVRALVFDTIDAAQRGPLREACTAILEALDPATVVALAELGAGDEPSPDVRSEGFEPPTF